MKALKVNYINKQSNDVDSFRNLFSFFYLFKTLGVDISKIR